MRKECVVLMLSLFGFLFLSCAGEEKDLANLEAKATVIMKKAERLMLANKQVEALIVYKQLALKFPETTARRISEIKLMKLGISIEKPLLSWTSIRMIKMENSLLTYRNDKGAFPLESATRHPLDAWGNEIYFKLYPPEKTYDFIVFSRGPDKMKNTGDDILIVHEKDEIVSKKTIKKQKSLSLDEIMELEIDAESESDSEVTLSLETIKKGAKSVTKNKVLTLEDLKNLTKNK